MKRLTPLLAVFSLQALSGSTVFAAALELGPVVKIASAPFYELPQSQPAVDFAATGGYVASWKTTDDVLSRAVGPDDNPAGQVSIVSHDPRKGEDAHLTRLADGRFLSVVASGALQGFFLDASGLPAGYATLALHGSRPSLGSEATGGFVLAWLEGGGFGAWPMVQAGRFDADGQPVIGIAVAPSTEPPAIAALPDGGFAVAVVDPLTRDVMLWRFDAAGIAKGPPIDISEETTGDPAGTPAVRLGADLLGRLVVAWTDDSGAVGGPWARRVAANGEPLSLPELVWPYQPFDDGYWYCGLGLDAVSVRPDGSYLVVWDAQSYCGGTGLSYSYQDELRIRAYDASGAALTEPLKIADIGTGVVDVSQGDTAEGRHADAAASEDGWVVSWVRSAGASGIYAQRISPACGSGIELCLGERFVAKVQWKASAIDAQGQGRPLDQVSDSGSFWFFSPTNAELVVKVLDGTSINGKFWVFYGSLTDVEFDLQVTDRLTGLSRSYHNPAGTMASRADTEALPAGPPDDHPSAAPSRALAAPAADPADLELRGGRYRARVSWRVAATGEQGVGTAVPLTDETGTFWFFAPGNVELMVKVLDGRALNEHAWVFFASLTDVEFDLEITDTVTAITRTYHNAPGTMASVGDTNAFPDGPVVP